MALFDKENSRLLLGIGIGAASVLAAPFVLPVVAAVARPLVKELLKQGTLASIAARERLELAAETLADLVAEVRSELDVELAQRKSSRAGPPAVASAHARGPVGEA
ncbi:MAG: DUF5132 domain-containing protein [Polyangiales bacterium]